jgi:hypothetical protein
MKYHYLICLLTIACSGCREPERHNLPAGPVKVDAPLAAKLPVKGDPSFIIPDDTVSQHGPRNITRNLLTDKNGNIWIASWDGIIRYDGKVFTNMTLKSGLRHYHAFSAFEDRSGILGSEL